ncbi:MAG: DUF4870 domain-containing protein [Myxococcales bacterium]|jgi:uncharacterized membrane protein|nr:DUF4870 domain-containing protein [Myxococcales bacterium]
MNDQNDPTAQGQTDVVQQPAEASNEAEPAAVAASETTAVDDQTGASQITADETPAPAEASNEAEPAAVASKPVPAAAASETAAVDDQIGVSQVTADEPPAPAEASYEAEPVAVAPKPVAAVTAASETTADEPLAPAASGELNDRVAAVRAEAALSTDVKTADETALQPQDVIREQDKIMLILAYAFPFIPFFTVKDSEYVQWHAKQGMALWISVVGLSIVLGIISCPLAFIGIGFLTSILIPVLGIAATIAGVMAILEALKPNRWKIPVVEQISAKLFK